MGFQLGQSANIFVKVGGGALSGLLGVFFLASCTAHASQSFAEREAQLNQRSGLKTYEVEPQPAAEKLAQAKPIQQKAENPSEPPDKEVPLAKEEAQLNF